MDFLLSPLKHVLTGIIFIVFLRVMPFYFQDIPPEASMYFGHSLFDPQASASANDVSEGVMEPSEREENLEVINRNLTIIKTNIL